MLVRRNEHGRLAHRARGRFRRIEMVLMVLVRVVRRASTRPVFNALMVKGVAAGVEDYDAVARAVVIEAYGAGLERRAEYD